MFTKLLSFHLLILIISLYALPTVRSSSEDSHLCSDSPVSLCPISCFRPDPVCGIDGVTYWCGCADARCAGTRVSKLGACEGNDSSVSGQALLLINILWLTFLAFFVLFGLLWLRLFCVEVGLDLLRWLTVTILLVSILLLFSDLSIHVSM